MLVERAISELESCALRRLLLPSPLKTSTIRAHRLPYRNVRQYATAFIGVCHACTQDVLISILTPTPPLPSSQLPHLRGSARILRQISGPLAVSNPIATVRATSRCNSSSALSSKRFISSSPVIRDQDSDNEPHTTTLERSQSGDGDNNNNNVDDVHDDAHDDANDEADIQDAELMVAKALGEPAIDSPAQEPDLDLTSYTASMRVVHEASIKHSDVVVKGYEDEEKTTLSRNARDRLKADATKHIKHTAAEFERYLSAMRNNQPDQKSIPTQDKLTRLVTRFMTTPDWPAYYGPVWNFYRNLDSKHQSQIAPLLIQYLSTTKNIVHLERASSLIEEMSVNGYSPNVVVAMITIYLKQGDLDKAIETWRAAYATKRILDGINELLIYCIKGKLFDRLVEFCPIYQDSPGRLEGPHVELRKNALKRDLAEIPDLPELTLLLRDYVINNRRVLLPRPLASYWKILETCAWTSVTVFKRRVPELLRVFTDPVMYQCYFELAYATNHMNDIPAIYEDYRLLRSANITPSVLRIVFKGCYPDPARLQTLHDDFIKQNKILDSWGYSRYMQFFGHIGDVEGVHRVWNQWRKHHTHWQGGSIVHNVQLFYPLINVHTRRGDYINAEAAFKSVIKPYGLKPDRTMWNMVFQAYVRAGEYEKALEKFDELCKNSQPTLYSYELIVALAARRGDLAVASELSRRVRELNLSPLDFINKGLVDAFCHNNLFEDAEKLCLEHYKTSTSPKPWNVLVKHYATRRDLVNCHRILTTMSKMSIKWDNETYQNILLSLVLTKQTTRAYQVLNLGVRHGKFEVIPLHFAIVMSGALRTRQNSLVVKMIQNMKRAGFSLSLEALSYLASAIYNLVFRPWRGPELTMDNAKRKEFVVKPLVDYFAYLSQPSDNVTGDSIPPVSTAYARGINDGKTFMRDPKIIARLLYVFSLFKDHDKIKQVAELYQKNVPIPMQSHEDYPLAIQRSLMASDLEQGKYENVPQWWESIWKSVMKLATPPGEEVGKSILPTYRHALSSPFGVMVDLYIVQEDGKALSKLLRQVLDAGFDLRRDAWNKCISVLASFDRIEEAFQYCEEYLIPGWAPAPRLSDGKTGRLRLSLESRRLRLSQLVLRPMPMTLLVLRDALNRLKSTAAWSSGSAERVEKLQRAYPLTVNACMQVPEPRTNYDVSQRTKDEFQEQAQKEAELRANAVDMPYDFYEDGSILAAEEEDDEYEDEDEDEEPVRRKKKAPVAGRDAYIATIEKLTNLSDYAGGSGEDDPEAAGQPAAAPRGKKKNKDLADDDDMEWFIKSSRNKVGPVGL